MVLEPSLLLNERATDQILLYIQLYAWIPNLTHNGFCYTYFLEKLSVKLEDKILMMQMAWLSSSSSIINIKYTQLKKIFFVLLLNKTYIIFLKEL